MAGAERAIICAVEKLGGLLIDEIKFLNEVREGILWMQEELRWISGFLEDADAKAMNEDNKTKNWIIAVTNIAQEAEDVVDTFVSKIETKNRQRRFRRIAGIPSKILRLHHVGTEILRIKTKISDISDRKERYGIINNGESSSSRNENLRAQRNLNPRLSENKIFVGSGGHENLILERLIDPEVKKCVVVPIVGMGGLGKTTLAARIYNSDVVKDWFCYRAWVTVSEEFNPLKLLHDLLRQVEGNSGKNNTMDTTELKVQVLDCLKKQRYLIVMDDIWEQDPDVWKLLKDAFPDEENGSRVLITSRSIGVGKSVDPSNEPYLLPFLGDKESWQLFLKVVFPSKDNSEPECPEALKTLGKDFVKKCGGLPLGVVILGGLLSITDPTIDAWNKVDIRWKYQHSDLGILALSYHHLPNVNLKSCFLYIGNYPEDHIIRASELTKFWIAEGFIPKVENQTFEETARDYLDEFVQRCMIQVVDRTKTSKRVKHLRIHNLFRKWCISEAQKDGFFRICTSSSDTSGPEIIAARRLTVYKSTLDDRFSDLSYKARAIMGFNYLSVDNFLLSKIGQNFKLLRVIYLKFPEKVNIHKSKILKGISSLIHLRNITLISNALTYLPSSIGNLHNLQTLNIKSTCILTLPVTLYKIMNLRHLYTRGVTIGTSVVWNPRNMHTLDSITAGSWMLKDFTKLSSLRKLSISRITQDEVICLQDSLHKMIHLKSLHLEADGRASATSLFTSFRKNNPLSKLVLMNWSNVSSEFPQNLITIRLSGCTSENGAIASLEKMPNLTSLHLEHCSFHWQNPFISSANGFQQLENLHIDEMNFLLNWIIEKGALPKIKCLMIRTMDLLVRLPDGLEHLKSLQNLEMYFPEENLQRISEDLHKIPQITSVTLNGTPLDEYKRSSVGLALAIGRLGGGLGAPVRKNSSPMDSGPSSLSMASMGLRPLLSLSMASVGLRPSSLPKASGTPGGSQGRPWSSGMHLNRINGDDERIIIVEKLAGEKITMGHLQVSFNKKMMKAELGEVEKKVMLEVMGLNPSDDSHGVDFVTVLDVGQSNIGILKSAMKFLIRKLRSIDRLSIIVFSSKPVKLCPLRQITERSLVDIENLVKNLIFCRDRNVNAGIQMGLEVINCRRFFTGRLAAIMLMSDESLSEYDHSTALGRFGNIPVYTFGLGEHCDPEVLNRISNASMGGTFSFIGNSDDFSIAFSQCFTALFGVAVKDLKLSLCPMYSVIQSIFSGKCTQFTKRTSGSVTIISFGDLYVNELRRIIVNLLLPVAELPHDPVEVLQLTSSDDKGEYEGGVISILRTSMRAVNDESDDEEERKVLHDPDSIESENFRLHIPAESAPASEFSSLVVSPRRKSNVELAPSTEFINCFSVETSPEKFSPLFSSNSRSPVRSRNRSTPRSPHHEINSHANLHPLLLPPGAAPKIEPSHWQKKKLIGRGSCGNVYKAMNMHTGAICAMKEVDIIIDDPRSAECLKQLEQEIKVLSQLEHPNIVKYIGSEMTQDRLLIYQEYVYPGPISKYVRDHCGVMTESVLCNFTRHILNGLAYLHSSKIIHRDIKGANLLVDINGVLKLADFGTAKILNEATGAGLSMKGATYWMAPEVLQSIMYREKGYDYAVDIWSLGCTVIEMFTGEHPWSGFELIPAVFKTFAHKEHPKIPDDLSPEGKHFLRLCFQRNPADRPPAAELLKHPFIRNSPLDDSLGAKPLSSLSRKL